MSIVLRHYIYSASVTPTSYAQLSLTSLIKHRSAGATLHSPSDTRASNSVRGSLGLARSARQEAVLGGRQGCTTAGHEASPRPHVQGGPLDFALISSAGEAWAGYRDSPGRRADLGQQSCYVLDMPGLGDLAVGDAEQRRQGLAAHSTDCIAGCSTGPDSLADASEQVGEVPQTL